MFNLIAPRPFEFEERCLRSCLGVKFFARFGASNFYDTFAPGNNPLETGQPTNDPLTTANPNFAYRPKDRPPTTTPPHHLVFHTTSPAVQL
jgi:hypothetical protein